MHPNTFYASLLNRPKRNEVFVIMSFAPEFESTWTQIIKPAIQVDANLTPNRVDSSQSGESIVHDILDGIANARLVLGDITCTVMRDRRGKTWPQRNGNVMWEVGIAHVARVPDEVILIRADDEESIFDLTQFRAFYYNPSNIAESRAMVANLCKDRLRAVEQFQNDYVVRLASELDYHSWLVLLKAAQHKYYKPPVVRTTEDAMRNISVQPALARLLQMGALQTAYAQITPEYIKTQASAPYEETMRYDITPLGSAIVNLILAQSGVLKPEMISLLQEMQQCVGGSDIAAG